MRVEFSLLYKTNMAHLFPSIDYLNQFSIVSSTGCGGNYHKKCAYKIPNNCSDSRHRASTTLNNVPHSHTLPRPASQVGGWNEALHLQQSNSLTESMPSQKERRATWSGPPVWTDPLLSGRIQVPHTFAIHSYKKPTVCQICKRLVGCVSFLIIHRSVLRYNNYCYYVTIEGLNAKTYQVTIFG